MAKSSLEIVVTFDGMPWKVSMKIDTDPRIINQEIDGAFFVGLSEFKKAVKRLIEARKPRSIE